MKLTIDLLLTLLIKTNLLRIKGSLLGSLLALILISGLIVTSTVAGGSLIYSSQKIKKRDDSINII